MNSRKMDQWLADATDSGDEPEITTGHQSKRFGRNNKPRVETTLAQPKSFQPTIAREKIRTPDDLATYFANRVSTPDRPYRAYLWMGDWFSDRLDEVRWCGPEPELPVVLTLTMFPELIDFWAAQNPSLRGRRIWESWSEWLDNADFVSEGFIKIAPRKPSPFRLRVVAHVKALTGETLDDMAEDFNDRWFDLAEKYPDLPVLDLPKKSPYRGAALALSKAPGETRSAQEILEELEEASKARRERLAREAKESAELDKDLPDDEDYDFTESFAEHNRRLGEELARLAQGMRRPE